MVSYGSYRGARVIGALSDIYFSVGTSVSVDWSNRHGVHFDTVTVQHTGH
jgi:hypothetical protein